MAAQSSGSPGRPRYRSAATSRIARSRSAALRQSASDSRCTGEGSFRWRTPKRKLPSPVQRESLADWRRAAERLRAILLVAADLYRGRPGEPDDWAAIGAEWRTDPRARQGWLGLMREHGWDPEAWK